MNKIKISIILLISYTILTGFNTDNAIVPQPEILSGGPPKDGIPAILKPKIVLGLIILEVCRIYSRLIF